MYVKNGIVYGDLEDTGIKVAAAKTLPDMILLLTFSNGETRLLDATDLKGPVYEALKDPAVFNHIMIDHGVVTWQNGEIDCAPEYMYEHSYEYAYRNEIVV